MKHRVALFLFCVVWAGASARAEVRTLTLKQAVELALQQNPDVALARLDEQRAALEVQVVREPLLPRVYAGSGLAYSNGFPMSIEGSAPSIVQAKAVRNLYSRPQGFQVAQMRELARGATLSSAQVREEIALKTAVLFLDFEKATRSIELAAKQLDQLRRVEALVRLRIEEGRESEIEGRRAALNAARARQKAGMLERQARRLGSELGALLGLPPAETLQPAAEERAELTLPVDEAASVSEALRDNPEIRKLESDIAAKNLQARSFRAMRYPKIDLVAQYGLFSKINNYTDYFRTFQANNGQIGLSVSVPLFANPQDLAQAAQSEIDRERLAVQLHRTRGRVENETRQAWEEIRQARTSLEIARLDLDVSREQTRILLAQLDAGRVLLKDVELARMQEEDRWLQLYEARTSLERAQLQILRQTRTLIAALK